MSISFSRNQVKWLAILAMTIDHIAWAFVPTHSVLGTCMHVVGRITGPVMAYFLYEGFLHTHDLKKYAIRLGIFALLSWPAASLFEYGRWPYPYLGVIYTLFLGLLAMWVEDRSGWHPCLRAAALVSLILLSRFGDWAYYDVICPLLLVSAGTERERRKRYAAATLFYGLLLAFEHYADGRGVNWFQLGVILPVLLICFCYKGQAKTARAGWKKNFSKWFFYCYYPLHLFLLYVLKVQLGAA